MNVNRTIAALRQFGKLGASLAFASMLAVAANAQTDVAASVYGAFNQSTSGNNTVQSPSNQAGVLVELRHLKNPLVGYEASYAFNRANQTYTNATCAENLSPCPTTTFGAVSANAHEVTADWLVSLKLLNIRPFALAGGGVLFDAPQSARNSANFASAIQTRTSTKPVLVYGAGLDWTVLPHLGLRFQYRGNVYKAPDLTSAFASTGAFTRTAEPMIGAFLRF